jgi:hypothetical protein
MSTHELVSPLAERSRLRARLWRFNRNRVLLYRAIVRVRNDGGGRRFVTRDTAVVIDGFERSGNTFAYLAFLDANPAVSSVAHHTHSPAQFYWAGRWSVPSILLVRDPAEVAISVTLRWPARSPATVVEDWIKFHQRIERLPLHDLVVAPFEFVIEDFGSVIEALNDRTGTSFARFDPTDAATARVYQSIETRNAGRYGRITEVAVARPSEARRRVADARRRELDTPTMRSLLDEARSLRARLIGATT